jgi:hypothetical protein
MFEWFDPTNWFITFQDYERWWFYMVNVLFKGIWAKIIATLCLLISVYSVVRRKFRPIIGLICFFVSIFFAYAGAVLNWFGS